MTSHTKENGVLHNNDLYRTNTVQTINMSPEIFEKLYLQPQNRVHGDLRRTFGNPTPLPLLGFLIASSPLGVAFMGWGGSGGGGAATVGLYYFFGGMLQIIGSLLEWFIGNTFPFVVFGSFGAFWLAFAATLTPFYNAQGAFTTGATTAAETAAATAKFEASLMYFPLFVGILVFMYLICSLRINIVFFGIFLFLDIALFLLSGAYYKASHGDIATFEKLIVATGACVFVFCVLGWYLLFVQLLQTVEFPLDLPVGDLSRFWKKKAVKREDADLEKSD